MGSSWTKKASAEQCQEQKTYLLCSYLREYSLWRAVCALAKDSLVYLLILLREQDFNFDSWESRLVAGGHRRSSRFKIEFLFSKKY